MENPAASPSVEKSILIRGRQVPEKSLKLAVNNACRTRRVGISLCERQEGHRDPAPTERSRRLVTVETGASIRTSRHGGISISVPHDLAISDSDTFVRKTDSAAPELREDLEKMARRRFQNPKPFKEGAFWWLLCWQDCFVNGVRTRKRKRVKLAPATMTAREAKKVASEYITPLNQGLGTLGSATNFTEYVNTTYKVNNLPLMAASTRERYSGVIKNYLIPAFDSRCLRDLTPMTVQGYFSGMAGS